MAGNTAALPSFMTNIGNILTFSNASTGFVGPKSTTGGFFAEKKLPGPTARTTTTDRPSVASGSGPSSAVGGLLSKIATGAKAALGGARDALMNVINPVPTVIVNAQAPVPGAVVVGNEIGKVLGEALGNRLKKQSEQGRQSVETYRYPSQQNPGPIIIDRNMPPSTLTAEYTAPSSLLDPKLFGISGRNESVSRTEIIRTNNTTSAVPIWVWILLVAAVLLGLKRGR